MNKLIAALALALVSPSFSQTASEWKQEQKSDPLRDTSYLQFTLTGKFLAPPTHGSLTEPVMVLHCTPGSFSHGKAHGKFIDGFITVGAVLNTHVHEGSSLSKVGVVEDIDLRLDARKLQKQEWAVSTDRTSVYISVPLCDFCAINNLFYGHDLPHKENSNDQVHQVRIGVNEYLAGEVVMQFNLPDVSQVGDVCGVISHK